MEITVQEGRVVAHKVDLVLDTEDVKIFDIDITSKYFDIDSYILYDNN